MLSYRHEFHAGNYADVFKHLCQSLVLQQLTRKPKPLTYLDSHSAAGRYNLASDMAQKTAEFVGGVDALLRASLHSTQAQGYLALVESLREQNQYPGSPAVAANLLRAEDRLVLMELHNTEINNLRDNMGGDPRVAIHHRDGFEGLLAVTPPTPARGLALIDPPYERTEEYQQVVKTLKALHQRWPVGVIALWYPLLAKKRNKAPAMIEAIAKNQPSSLYRAEIWVKSQPDELGMYGCGMAFINLPWQVDVQIESLMPELVQALGNQQGGCFSEWIIKPE